MTADPRIAAGAVAWPALSWNESAGPFAAAFAATRIAMLITDARAPDNPIAFVNDAFLRLTGYSREEVVGRNCRFLQGAETDPAAVEEIRHGLRAGSDVSVELLNYRKDGSPFWNALFINPIRDAGGRIAYFFSAQLDVTASKRIELRLQDAKAQLEAEVERRTAALTEALRTKEILLHEVDHRVKNNLQLVGSLLSVQARRIPHPTVRASLHRALERVSALSMMHQTLYQGADPGRFDVAAFTRQLAQDLKAAAGRDDVELRLELEPLELSAVKGAPVALILNELLINALRHGLPTGRGGTIGVTLRREDGRLLMLVEDDGVGMPAIMPRDGFGTTLVRSLARQLAADLAWERPETGTRVRLKLAMNGDRDVETR